MNQKKPNTGPQYRFPIGRRHLVKLRKMVLGGKSVLPRKPPPPREVLPLPEGLSYDDLLPPLQRGEAADTVPHPGSRYQRLLQLAQSHPVPDDHPNPQEQQIVARGFDEMFYLTRRPDMPRLVHRMSLLGHYLRAGNAEGRDPSPHFSTGGYQKRNPDVVKSGENPFAHWLRKGLPEGRIASPLPEFEEVCRIIGRDPADIQLEMIHRRSDLRARLETGTLGEMVKKAAAHEPLIEQVWPAALAPHIQPFHVPQVVRTMTTIHRMQKLAGFRRAKAIVCVNAPRWGAGRRMEGHLAFALAAQYGPENVLMMSLDKPGDMPDWKRPAGVRYVDFADMAKGLDNDFRQRALLGFLRSLRPEAVFNVNSNMLWKLLGEFGPVMAMDVPVVGCFFCNDRNDLGYLGGYPASQFYRCLDHVKAMAADSHFLINDLARQFAVTDADRDRMVVLEAPVDPAIPIAPAPDSPAAAQTRAATALVKGETEPATEPDMPRRKTLFWAGRLDPQKRLDLVYAIARALPDLDIRVWGSTVAGGVKLDNSPPDNVLFEGAYASFADLPMHDCDAWLYTSAWDGVPSILLEVAMTAVPIIGSDVGGTAEVLHADLSWPIADWENPRAYIDALQTVLADPDSARRKARALRERLIARRTEAAYQETARRLVEEVGQ